MKILFICNTYYQIIIALQLKFTYFKENQVDLWLSDRSVNAKLVCARLAKLNIFRKTEFKEIKHDKLGINEFAAYLKSGFGIIDDEKFDFYDEIIFFNLEMILFKISDFYKKNKFVTTWSKMEEGIFSYDNDFITGKGIEITRILRKKTNLTDIVDSIKNYYCFFPDLKTTHREWNLIKIPTISEKINEQKKILNYIFDYKPTDYKQKYIFFASSSDIDKQSFGETEFVLELAKKIGIENLLVKMHPRDNRKVYEEHGIQVMRNSYVPWEVIQLNWEKAEHTLLTVTSGAFININSLLNQNTRGYFLYSYIKAPTMEFTEKTNKLSLLLDKLHALGLAQNIVALKENEL